MENIQINGQRRWGPPNDWSGPPPPHGTEVFVKNLPVDINEEQLYHIFSTAGKVYEVRLPVHWSGESRGYAFVRFTEVREADAAIRAFNGMEFQRNWRIEVQRSVDNTRLFLSSVPKNKTADQLKKDLSELVENVKKVYVYRTLEDRNVFRGYAFVEFETHRDAAIAKRILTPDVCSSLFEKKCIAAWANPLPFIDGSLLETLNILFMRNIPKELKTLELKKELKNILEADDECRVKRLNDFAFLTFKDHGSAQRALEILKGNSRLTDLYEIQVEWAIPRELVNGLHKQLLPVHGEPGHAENSNLRGKKIPRPQLENKTCRSHLADASNFHTSRLNATDNRAALGYEGLFAGGNRFCRDPDLAMSHQARGFHKTDLTVPLRSSVPMAARGIEENRAMNREEKPFHLRFCNSRDSSLSPTAATGSSGSSVALWNSESEASLSPPSKIFTGDSERRPGSNTPLANFEPYRAFYQADSTVSGVELLIRPNPGMYFY